jgi:hypothetical protein
MERRPHFHSCPECYEAVPCNEDCTILYDISTRDRLFGGYYVCEACQDRARVRAERERLRP